MARFRRPTVRWTGVTLLHLAAIAALGSGIYLVLPAGIGAIGRGAGAIGVTLTASLAADRALGRLYGKPEPRRAAAALMPGGTNAITEMETEIAR